MNMANKTLGELLSDPRIQPIAGDAIRARDLSTEEVWGKTPAELKAEQFFSGEIMRGFERLYAAADSGDWYYPLYSAEECLENPARQGVSLVWMPSADPKADGRPYLLLVPGGGFVNVWNLTEGWPIAEQFNRLGVHVFILTYQVEGKQGLLDTNMEDFARALQLIRKKEDHFHVRGDRYMTCGFSAGETRSWSTLARTAREQVLEKDTFVKVCGCCEWFELCRNTRRGWIDGKED